MEPDMPIIHSVPKGNGGGEIRTVSLGTLFTVVGLLGSVIGAQTTWLVAAAHERTAVVREFEESLHAAEAASVSRLIGIEANIKGLDSRLLTLEKQVHENTGILKAMRDK